MSNRGPWAWLPRGLREKLSGSPRRPMETFRTLDIVFLGEQDGEVERDLKNRLSKLFSEDCEIERAYLARVSLDGAASVCLCLRRPSGDSEQLARSVAIIFSDMFNRHQHLDIKFISAEQDTQLRSVCQPFYGVARP